MSSEKSPIAKIWDGIGKIADVLDLSRRRLRSVEDRLARLDGGPDGSEAPGAAYDALQAARRKAGKPPLSMERPS